MWAQDAMAMYGYAASSAAAGTLNPLTPPSQTTNPAGIAAQAAAVGQAAASSTVQQVGLGNLITNLRNAVMGFAAPVTSAIDATGLGGIVQCIDDLLGMPVVQSAVNGAVNTAAWFVMNTIPNAVALGQKVGELTAVPLAGQVAPAAAGASGLAHLAVPVGTPLAAGLGEASSVGGLSVPASWSTATPAMTVGASVMQGSGWTTATDEAAPIAGMPGMASAAKGAGAYAGPRYGFRPVVMPKQVVV